MEKSYLSLFALITLLSLAVAAYEFYSQPQGWSSQPLASNQTPTGPTFNHQLHTQKLGLDCRYCHTGIQQNSQRAGLPSVESCMGCHAYVGKELESLETLRQSYLKQQPIQWKISNQLPDHAHFHHGKHVEAGLKCQTCHGDVQNTTSELGRDKPLQMQWCLECHQDPHASVDYSLDLKKQDQTQTTKMRDCQTCHH